MRRSTRIILAAASCAVVAGGAFFLPQSSARPAGGAAPAAVSAAREIGVPIIVYHVVRPSYPSDDAAVRAIALTPETFDAEMRYLRDAGYHVIRLSDLESALRGGAALPPNPVVLSFDDGWHDQFVYALPILEKYHYPATFFIFTNSIGRPGFLSWSDLHALIKAGMTIGSHSRSHPFLTRIRDQATLWQEIRGSKLLLESNLGVPVTEFAYPFGAYDPGIIRMVEAAGYRSARGDYFTGGQTPARLYALSAMNAKTALKPFAQKLRGLGAPTLPLSCRPAR